MSRPTTHVASNQSSQLEHPSYFSNSLLMDESNSPSIHLDTNSLLTPTRGHRRRQESSSSPPLPPARSTLYQRPRNHAYASHFQSTVIIAPAPSWPSLLLCIKQNLYNENEHIRQPVQACRFCFSREGPTCVHMRKKIAIINGSNTSRSISDSNPKLCSRTGYIPNYYLITVQWTLDIKILFLGH